MNKTATTVRKKISKPFKVVGTMSWVNVKLGAYKSMFEANKAIEEFKSRKIYTNLRVEEVTV
ncbi:hypothetical protein GW796_08385 [archaeon]|nr:hypothetical protein [archaeon]